MKTTHCEVESPCIQLCRISPDNGLCEGCFRSIDEITLWNRLNDAQKTAVIQRIAERREQAAQAGAFIPATAIKTGQI